MDILAALHDVDPDAVGLGGLGRRDGYVERTLRRWRGQWEKSKSREIPLIEEVADRLAADIPAAGPTRIVHGDYRLDNAIVSPDRRVGAGRPRLGAVHPRRPSGRPRHAARVLDRARRRDVGPVLGADHRPRVPRPQGSHRPLRRRLGPGPVGARLLRRPRLLEDRRDPRGRLRPLRLGRLRRHRRQLAELRDASSPGWPRPPTRRPAAPGGSHSDRRAPGAGDPPVAGRRHRPARGPRRARAALRGRPAARRRAVRAGRAGRGGRGRGRRNRLRPDRADRRRRAGRRTGPPAGRGQRGRRATTTSTSRPPPPPGWWSATPPASSTRPRPTSPSSWCWPPPGAPPRPRPCSGPGRWTGFHIEEFLGRDVHGATLGLVGYGRIGRAVARRAGGFAMEVLHHTRTPTGEPGWIGDLHELLGRADIVSLHVPLTPADPPPRRAGGAGGHEAAPPSS